MIEVFSLSNKYIVPLSMLGAKASWKLDKNLQYTSIYLYTTSSYIQFSFILNSSWK